MICIACSMESFTVEEGSHDTIEYIEIASEAIWLDHFDSRKHKVDTKTANAARSLQGTNKLDLNLN